MISQPLSSLVRKRRVECSDSGVSVCTTAHIYVGNTTCRRGRSAATRQSDSTHQTSYWAGLCRVLHTGFRESNYFYEVR
jgi:hypothetical protein